MQHQHTGLGPVQDHGEAGHTVIAPVEEGGMLRTIGAQRQIGVFGEGLISHGWWGLGQFSSRGSEQLPSRGGQRFQSGRSGPARLARPRPGGAGPEAVGAIEQAEWTVALTQAAKDAANRRAGREESFQHAQPERIGERVERLLLGADQPAELGVVERLEKRAEVA